MPPKKRFRIVPWLLVILPLWLIASGVFALVKYFKAEDRKLVEEQQRFARTVSADSLADDLRKIIEVIGERNTEKPKNLSATASMIEGLLGPGNTGYNVGKIDGPAGFPIITAKADSINSSAPPIWILTSYDSPSGSRGAEKNATGLAATLALAQAVADSKLLRPIRFIILPHVNQSAAPIEETATTAYNLIQADTTPHAILCIEAMGEQEQLILTSQNPDNIPTKELSGLGTVQLPETTYQTEASDLATMLHNKGLPTLRIATRPTLLPSETDNRPPFAPTLTASTGRLIELTLRLTNSPQ